MQNSILLFFLLLAISHTTYASQNLELIRKMSEQTSFYKNQPRPKRSLGVTDIKVVEKSAQDNDVEIIDLESEFHEGSKNSKSSIRSRLRQ